MGRGLFIAVWITSAWASEASAQRERDHRQRLVAEQLMLEDESREVTGLYVAGACLFSAGAVLGVVGGLTLVSGDTIGPGIILLPPAPLLGAIGIALLAIAAATTLASRPGARPPPTAPDPSSAPPGPS